MAIQGLGLRVMKNLSILLGAFVLIGCGEKNESADNGETVAGAPSGNPARSPEGAVAAPSTPPRGDLHGLPEVITKEFILALWDKPHSDKNLIEELRHRKAGRWSAEINWEGEDVDQTYSGVSKFVDGRFDVTRANGITDGKEWVQYDFVTYDSSSKRYRKFTLGADEKINEATGRVYWKKLAEWRPVGKKGEGVDWVTRETLRNDSYLKGETEFREDGKRVALSKFKVTFLP